jgi:chemotaxis signal transduction protein
MQAIAFRAADMRFALPIGDVVQVLPDCVPRPLPLAPPAVTGLIRYGRALIPVVDLGLLLGAGAAAMRRSTRLIIVRVTSPSVLLFALRAEEVLDLIRIGEQVGSVPQPRHRWLGDHILDDAETPQLIGADALMPDELRALYVADAADDD